MQGDGENTGCLRTCHQDLTNVYILSKLHQISLKKYSVAHTITDQYLYLISLPLPPEATAVLEWELRPWAIKAFILSLQMAVPTIYSIVLCILKIHIKSFRIFLQVLNFFLIMMLWTCIHVDTGRPILLIYRIWRKLDTLKVKWGIGTAHVD